MNHEHIDDLDRVRETVDALAHRVDTAAGWDAVASAVDRQRHGRDRARRGAQLATVLVSVIAVIGGVVYARSGSNPSSLQVTEPSTPPASSGECVLPSLPVPGARSADTDPLVQSLNLSGPAVAALKGGAVVAPFELDGGRLTVTPPRPGDTPALSANQAECAALATSNANGYSLLESARSYGGAAVGYGRVSVDPQLIANPESPLYLQGQTNDNTKPTLPAPAAYQQRLAWLVVVKNVLIFHGGGSFSPGTTTTSPAPPTNGYDVFLVDAQTGADALLYTESQPPSLVASVMVPAENVSVPWTLVSRSPDGYHGEIKATVLACDGYPSPVSVDRDNPVLAVVVERPVNASCGAAKEVTLPLVAATVTSDLPEHIDHEPLGPYVALPNPAAPPRPGDTGRVLKLVNEQDNGTTIHVTVGSVLAVGPLHDGGQYAAVPVTSTDPGVLGALLADEVYEFRAWHTGTADLSEPATTCNAKGKGQPCTGPWVLHVIVG